MSSLSETVPAHVPPDRVFKYDFFREPGLVNDLYGTIAMLREKPAVFYTPCNDGHWVVTKGDVIAKVLKTPELFSNFPYLIPKAAGSPQQTPLTEMDAPEHTEYRRLVQQQMVPALINRMEAGFRASTARLIDGVYAQGHCEFVTDIGQILPIDIFLDWMALPRERREDFMGWVQQLLRGKDPETRRQGKLNTLAYLRSIIDERVANPGEDLISKLALAPFRGRTISADELMPVVAGLFNAGLDTVTSNMSFTLRFLAEHPAHQRQLAENPALIPKAIEEMMRFFTTANLARSCTRDTELDGVPIKKGEQVLVPFVLYGLDEQINPDALTVDFNRKTPAHLSFGAGPHVCAGAYLARLELRVLLEEWFKRIPQFSVAAGTKIETMGGVIFGIKALPLVWEPAV